MTSYDFNLLGYVEKRLEAEIGQKNKQDVESAHRNKPAYHSNLLACERRINRVMHISECFPNRKLSLLGKLSVLTRTVSKDTFRANLMHKGEIVTTLYINFNNSTCTTCDLMPKHKV